MTLEQWVLRFLLAAEKEQRTPLYFYGMTNAIKLYLEWPGYSPFVPRHEWMTEEEREQNVLNLVQFYNPAKYINPSTGKYFTQDEWTQHCEATWAVERENRSDEI